MTRAAVPASTLRYIPYMENALIFNLIGPRAVKMHVQAHLKSPTLQQEYRLYTFKSKFFYHKAMTVQYLLRNLDWICVWCLTYNTDMFLINLLLIRSVGV